MPSTEPGVRLPAEWEQQAGVMLTWPHTDSDWQSLLDEIEPVYIALCKAISHVEHCLILCQDDQHQRHVEQQLRQQQVVLERCHLFTCSTNDTWCRDYGPLTTFADDRPILNNFEFNGWGNKYEAGLDNAVSRNLQGLGIFGTNKLIDHNVVLEGGSIESDGSGALLTTTQCLLKRHPDKSKSEIEQLLHTSLGARRVFWLEHGHLSGDDTDSHIDNLARFVDANTIVYSACRDRSHPDHDALMAMQDELNSFKKKDGSAYRLIPVYLPSPIYYDNQLLPASYVNFLIINDAVLVPAFAQPEDRAALEIYQQCFPGRRIIALDSRALIKQYGGIHCATMQFPDGVLSP